MNKDFLCLAQIVKPLDIHFFERIAHALISQLLRLLFKSIGFRKIRILDLFSWHSGLELCSHLFLSVVSITTLINIAFLFLDFVTHCLQLRFVECVALDT